MTELRITIPLTPPSANHYVKHTRAGRHYVTGEAKAFKEATAICATGIGSFDEGELEVWITVYLGKGVRLDVDNAGKVTLDSLTYAKIIHSDAAVIDLHLSKRRDRENPRTEILIREAK